MEYTSEETKESVFSEYTDEIIALIRSNLAPKPLYTRLSEYHEKDISAALGQLTLREREKLYRMPDIEMLSSILEYAEEREIYLGELELKKRIAVLSRIEISSAAEYLDSIPKGERAAILGLLPEETGRELNMLSSFDEDELGSRMSTNYISIVNTLSVRDAMRSLISQAAENDNVSTIYVTDEDGILVGAIPLKELIIARAETPLDDIIMTSYPYAYASSRTDECLERIRGYSEDTIPLLDRENRLIGVLTSRELTEAIEEEIGEDYAKLGGLSAEEELSEPVFQSVRKRLPWLAALFVLGLLVSWVVGRFEAVAAELPIIVSFQSLILGMAGNVGTQSLAVTIRLLTDGRLTKKQKIHLISKEARVGLTNGVILGLASFALIGAYIMIIKGDPLFAFSVSLCTGAALMAAMLLSGIFGASIPLILKKVGVDPAVASGPFITTVNDLVAVITYYGLAWLLLLNL